MGALGVTLAMEVRVWWLEIVIATPLELEELFLVCTNITAELPSFLHWNGLWIRVGRTYGLLLTRPVVELCIQEKAPWIYRRRWEEAIKDFNLKISWVYRECNFVADTISKKGANLPLGSQISYDIEKGDHFLLQACITYLFVLTTYSIAYRAIKKKGLSCQASSNQNWISKRVISKRYVILAHMRSRFITTPGSGKLSSACTEDQFFEVNWVTAVDLGTTV